MTEEEKEAVMKDDFHVDSGGDGSVDREEFRFSIFQLADQWTCSVNADEYIAFLKRGYSIVFQDMIEADKLQWPLSWAEELKKVKSLTPMPIIRSVDIMTGILKGKLKADQVAATNNRAMITLEKYVIDYFKTKHGDGVGYLKHFKSFVLALINILNNEDNPVYHFAMLFAQMCGFHTKSTRITPFPHEASVFLLQHFEEMLKIAKSTSTKFLLPKKNQANKIGIDSRSNMIVSGVLDLNTCSDFLSKILNNELGISNKKPLHKISMLSLAALSSEVNSSIENNNNNINSSQHSQQHRGKQGSDSQTTMRDPISERNRIASMNRAIYLAASDVFALGIGAYEVARMAERPEGYRVPTNGKEYSDLREGLAPPMVLSAMSPSFSKSFEDAVLDVIKPRSYRNRPTAADVLLMFSDPLIEQRFNSSSQTSLPPMPPPAPRGSGDRGVMQQELTNLRKRVRELESALNV
mmetsp:Transcript_6246/g.7627  ORF Transcript_6246/g.7627 Transcript_6246/m.7627 type:complete len:466 (+) Transcript_6246:701-2098(+)